MRFPLEPAAASSIDRVYVPSTKLLFSAAGRARAWGLGSLAIRLPLGMIAWTLLGTVSRMTRSLGRWWFRTSVRKPPDRMVELAVFGWPAGRVRVVMEKSLAVP